MLFWGVFWGVLGVLLVCYAKKIDNLERLYVHKGIKKLTNVQTTAMRGECTFLETL